MARGAGTGPTALTYLTAHTPSLERGTYPRSRRRSSRSGSASARARQDAARPTQQPTLNGSNTPHLFSKRRPPQTPSPSCPAPPCRGTAPGATRAGGVRSPARSRGSGSAHPPGRAPISMFQRPLRAALCSTSLTLGRRGGGRRRAAAGSSLCARASASRKRRARDRPARRGRARKPSRILQRRTTCRRHTRTYSSGTAKRARTPLRKCAVPLAADPACASPPPHPLPPLSSKLNGVACRVIQAVMGRVWWMIGGRGRLGRRRRVLIGEWLRRGRWRLWRSSGL
mmetsp:Transcript_4216/g.8279  ORF Transcript_4216/g.8279 Transcript_4216/m.8279 type:complete len:284 (+) Transcript_4216:1237-2088(+)